MSDIHYMIKINNAINSIWLIKLRADKIINGYK